MSRQDKSRQRLGRGEQGEYYLEYNAKSLTFPRNVFHAPKLQAAARLARALPDRARVLDAGCGSGYVSAPLANRLRVTGVDIEDEAVAFCKKHRQGTFVRADLTRLPFPDRHFDLVLFTNTIEHLEDPHPVLAELSRVLAPKGRILVTTENCANIFWLLLEQTWYRFWGGPCKPYLHEVHPQRYTPRLLRGHLQAHFRLESLQQAVLGMELLAVADPQEPASHSGKQRRSKS